MIATLIPTELRLPEPKAPRSFGVHVSTLIKSVALKNKVLKPEHAGELKLIEVGGQDDWWKSLSPANRLRIALGLAWEEWYLPTLADQGVIDHPGEMCVESIYMTHDGESLDCLTLGPALENGKVWVPVVHEIKCTYKSSKTVGYLATQWMWTAQTKAYCKGLNTRHAYIHVLFPCGDYSFPITPQLKVWHVEYSQAEIDDNWDVLVTEMRHLQELEASQGEHD